MGVLTMMGLLSVLVTLSAAAFRCCCCLDLLYLDSTMIVELPSFTPSTSCRVESHPVPVTQAVTAVLNNVLHVCGGYADDGYQSACSSLTGGRWTVEPSMLEKRWQAASSIWPGHGLLVTGGSSKLGRVTLFGFGGSYAKQLSSTEYLSESGQWTPGPVLPVVMEGHCQVTADSDVIVTGGLGNGRIKASAYKLSTDRTGWTTLPSMTAPRQGHACVVYEGYLYAIGGASNKWGAAGTTVEKMELNTLTAWEAGPGLDTRFDGGQAIVYQVTIFLVYRDGKVMKLNTDGTDKWEEVADLGRTIGGRPVFPAPIVTPGAIGC